MAAYNLATSYANDHELGDFVESVTWERKNVTPAPDGITGTKARPLDLTNRSDAELAAGLSLTTDEQAWQWWPARELAYEPQQRDVIRRETKDKTGWVVQRVQRSQFGFFVLATVKEVVNVV